MGFPGDKAASGSMRNGLGNQGGGPRGVHDPAIHKAAMGGGNTPGKINAGNASSGGTMNATKQVRPASGSSRGGLGN